VCEERRGVFTERATQVPCERKAGTMGCGAGSRFWPPPRALLFTIEHPLRTHQETDENVCILRIKKENLRLNADRNT